MGSQSTSLGRNLVDAGPRPVDGDVRGDLGGDDSEQRHLLHLGLRRRVDGVRDGHGPVVHRLQPYLRDERDVHRDDAPEGSLLVGRVRAIPRLLERSPLADAARIRVLENRKRWPFALEFRDQCRGGGEVEDVVIRELLAMELLVVTVELSVQRRLLVRVLAVAQALHEGRADHQRRCGLAGFGEFLLQVGGDRGVAGLDRPLHLRLKFLQPLLVLRVGGREIQLVLQIELLDERQ